MSNNLNTVSVLFELFAVQPVQSQHMTRRNWDFTDILYSQSVVEKWAQCKSQTNDKIKVILETYAAQQNSCTMIHNSTQNGSSSISQHTMKTERWKASEQLQC